MWDVSKGRDVISIMKNLTAPCFRWGPHLVFLYIGYIIVLVNSNETKENNDEVIDQTIRELCRILKKSDDENFIYDFFKCLFTPPELKDFANRWLLVKELDKGTTQREIAKKYGMSLCKITRGSRELAKADSAFRKLLDIQKAQEDR